MTIDKKLGILVIDDKYHDSITDPLIEKYADKIHCKGYSSGCCAVKKFEEEMQKGNLFDIVVLDYNLDWNPNDKNGYEIAKKLRELSSEFELLGYSIEWYFNDEEAEKVGMKGGSDECNILLNYLYKTIDKEIK